VTFNWRGTDGRRTGRSNDLNHRIAYVQRIVINGIQSCKQAIILSNGLVDDFRFEISAIDRRTQQTLGLIKQGLCDRVAIRFCA